MTAAHPPDTRSRFQWPPIPISHDRLKVPRPAPSETRQPAPVPGPKGLSGRIRAMWIEFELAWLDPVAEPLDRRMALARWSPDVLDAYCDRCGRTIGPFEAAEFGCAACREEPLAWDRFVRLGSYQGALTHWIQEIKFTRFRALAAQLGRQLAAAARDAGALQTDAPVIVIPVPMSRRRYLGRGIDHAAAIARAVGRDLDRPVCRALRRDHRPSQRAVPPSDRQRNVAGSIHLRRGLDLAGRRILLIDDVRTSGSTLRAAALAIRGGRRRREGAPESIWACALAVTPDHDRPAEPATGDALWTS